ncbi:MAG: type II toxin-antitoxin system VapC family toxin [Candidatus Diapherotrites archaeon]|uniref:Ribonuclease VapC n=1 Tax=Candidatus Iainarchaeum sp. TaxID=3101447 RepID=A0A8T3YRB6_9ARCH|nr:type II toxin-antitoxin system VapC family toxin [Candidatus Diapherotrites archaeon]
MVCLDSDILVAATRNDRAAVSKIEELDLAGERRTVTPITITELYKGAYKSGSVQNISKAEELFSFLEVIEYDFDAAREAGRIFALLEQGGSKIGDMDTLIGAIALRHGETLLTRNAKHFAKIPGLKVEKW